MYRVYCDGLLLYHSNLENLKIFNPFVEVELNKTGSFEFTIYSDHPRYELIHKLKSIITVYQDDYLLFRGRVLDDEIGKHNEKRVVCEGELAFLLDSIQRPGNFTGTVAEFLSYIINNHNSQVEPEKAFTLGTVTVEGDLNEDLTEYTNSFETLQKRLLDAFGGYLITRYESGVVYLDYLKEINLLAQQPVELGKNLLDLKRIRKGSEIVTAIIPIGAEGLTIAAVNNGLDYIVDEDAKAQFGFIVKTVKFDGITDAAELLAAGEAHLSELVNIPETVEVTAADLATVNKAFTSFHLGTQVRVASAIHGLNHLFIVYKLSVKLLKPAENKLTLGKTVQAFSETVMGITDGQGLIIQTVEKNAQAASEAVYNVEQNLLSSIQVSEENIKSTVAENYYLKDETDALVSSVSTEIEQTKNSVEIQFTQFSQDIEAVAAGTDAEFEEIRKYIRFIDGKILLGEIGNELELQIANDRISFLQDGAEVAYFSNRRLYVTDAEILHSLQLGNFAFMPRANGNLSFKLSG